MRKDVPWMSCDAPERRLLAFRADDAIPPVSWGVQRRRSKADRLLVVAVLLPSLEERRQVAGPELLFTAIGREGDV